MFKSLLVPKAAQGRVDSGAEFLIERRLELVGLVIAIAAAFASVLVLVLALDLAFSFDLDRGLNAMITGWVWLYASYRIYLLIMPRLRSAAQKAWTGRGPSISAD